MGSAQVTPYDAGARARMLGLGKGSCPHAAGTPDSALWLAGWREAVLCKVQDPGGPLGS